MNGILAIDTTTEACSVALAADGEIHGRHQLVRRGHARVILAMIDAVLAETNRSLAGLQAIACCRGPGSFTGVRIGVGVAHGLALGADRPVVPVSTLATVAQGAYREHGANRIAVAMDARMGEVYWGCFRVEKGGLVAVGEEIVAAPGAVPLPAGADGEWLATGTGFDAHAPALNERLGARMRAVDASRLPDAADALALADPALAVAAEQLVPVYLRHRVATG